MQQVHCDRAGDGLVGFTAAEYFASHSIRAYRTSRARRILTPRQRKVFDEAMRRLANGASIRAVEAWARKAVAR